MPTAYARAHAHTPSLSLSVVYRAIVCVCLSPHTPAVLHLMALRSMGFLLTRGKLRNPQLCMCCSFHQDADVVHLNDMRPGYEGPIRQNGGFLCTHQSGTLLEHSLSDKETVGFFNGGQLSNKNMSMDCFIRCQHDDFGRYRKLLNTPSFKPASTSRSDTSDRISCKVLVFGAAASLDYSSGFTSSIPHLRKTCSRLWPQRRRDPLWMRRRPFSSGAISESLSNLELGSLDSSVLNIAAIDMTTEAEASLSSSESDEDYDFRNFPALISSFYQDYNHPIEMKPKKRVAWQTSRKLDSMLTLESIPEPKGDTYDFGLGDMSSKPPPLEEGARPQGGFDIDISLDECEEAPSERVSVFPILSQRMPSRKLPWDRPEADNWSEISVDSQYRGSKHEPEFCWDPYDFDASVKLPQKLDVEDSFSASSPA